VCNLFAGVTSLHLSACVLALLALPAPPFHHCPFLPQRNTITITFITVTITVTTPPLAALTLQRVVCV
jgi:hypothetical protein